MLLHPIEFTHIFCISTERQLLSINDSLLFLVLEGIQEMCVAQCQRLDYNWQTDTKSVFKPHYTMARKQLTTSTFYT